MLLREWLVRARPGLCKGVALNHVAKARLLCEMLRATRARQVAKRMAT